MHRGTEEETRARVLEVDGKPRVSDRSKANAFRAEYQRVSKLKLGKEDRWVKKAINSELRAPTVEGPMAAEFSRKELVMAIAMINPTKSPGPDMIHPRFLHHLGVSAKEYLVGMMNSI